MQFKPSFETQTCPTCNQCVKLYKRPITGTSAETLIGLYHLSMLRGESDGFFHLREFAKPYYTSVGDFAKLRYWGLIEELANDNPDKRTSGFWRITEKGNSFVLGSTQVKKYAWIFNSDIYGFSGPSQTISDRLGNKFSYEKLMRGES